ncbi:MAG: exodeoxyribonuclease V subunit gamma [Pseudomonadota bacterium]|nr:exodeoxyribonuclease V subunit gamma [Pseudomonadota bacterium]
MLQIIRSNAVESLLGQLARRVSDAPLSSPLAPEVVVAPSPAMARWINLQLAQQHGVAANFEYPLPASFVWSLSGQLLDDLPETDPLNLDVMAWKVFALLPAMLQEPAFESLRHYLRQDDDGLKRWQLASRIADVLDRYQLYRPELIRDWEEGKGEDWQAPLWRRLLDGIERQHRVAVIGRLLEHLGGPGSSSGLPERVSIFAVSSLPPLLVEVVHALAAHTQVDLYVHAPTDAFWADLISQKELARKRLEKPDEADLWEVGNGLLASWGRQGQALQDLLLAQETPMDEIDAFVEPTDDTLLRRLQQDIYALRPIAADGERLEVEADDSVQVHICHSALRECQVLHDQLLGMLDTDLDLRPEDVLVMVPEISLYDPYIEAVFDQDGERCRPFIPWNLSDISLKDEHPLVLVFLQLLDLPDSRFSHSEILSYLDVPELAGHFGLDSEAVVQIKDWLAQANLRWGLDGDHKRRLGLPAVEENTWSQAEKRLFGGYALGEGALFEDIAPIGSVEGAKGEVLGRFWRLFSRLTDWAERLSAPRSAGDWQASVSDLLGTFFGERDDEDGRVQKIRDAVSDLADQAGEMGEALTPALVRRWLEQRLGAEGRHGRYFSGGVTFCGMRPMRSLPFKVICVLGLQDQAFPRRDRLAEFDRMRKSWRPGDPRKADEDRYLFLETLLCARRRLYLSYVGRDIRKNTERQPSVLVRELLDYLDQQYRVVGGEEDDKLSKRLTTVHRLQPFSPHNFAGGRGSYDDYWSDVARAMLQPIEQEARGPLNWPNALLRDAPDQMREVTLVQLDRFVRHPVKYFVNSRLQLYLREEEPEEDEELFALDGLQSFSLKQRLVDEHLQGRMPSRRQLSAEGALPHGAFAEIVYEEESNKAAPLVERLGEYKQQRPEQVPIDLAFAGDAGPRRLAGQIKGVYPGLGLLRYKPSSLKGSDILSLWLAHLAWCAGSEPGEKCSTLYTTGDSFAIRETLAPDVARLALARYLGWYWQGVHRPLLVLPKASYAYAVKNKGGRADPLTAARSAWNGNSFREIPGDKDDVYVQLVMRGVTGDPLESEDFAMLAGEFYDQVLSSGELL